MYIDWYLAAIGGHVNTSARNAQADSRGRRVGSLWHAVNEYFRTWVQRQLLQQELESLTRSELDDIGMDRAEIPIIVKAFPKAGQLQRQMMERLGLDRERAMDAWPAVMRAVGRACAKCGERKRCEHWLDSGVVDESYRAFCPNGYRLAAIKLWQARRNAHA